MYVYTKKRLHGMQNIRKYTLYKQQKIVKKRTEL